MYWPIVFFFGGISVWFWNEGDGGIIECLWQYSFFFNLLKAFKEDGHQFLFICLIKFACESIWSWTFILLMRCMMLIDLHMLNHPCEPGMNPTWLWCMIFFICCWIWLAKI